MKVAQLHYLLSPAGHELLDEVHAAYDGHNALQVSANLRASHESGNVAAALTQVRLRRSAAVKFGADAASMFFTPAGLEQATHRTVARHRASRALGGRSTSVLDLGCGIGADLLAFSRAGARVVGVDRDPLTAAVAQANLEALRLEGTVNVGGAASWARDGFDLVFADPARRGAAGRVFDPDRYSPPWSFIAEVLTGEAAVKVAPGIPHQLIPPGVEAEWVSLDGRLREAVLWSGRRVSCTRRATVLSGPADMASVTDADDPGAADVRPVGRFVYEPDDAVIRAHLVTAVAAQVGGWLLDEHIAYVSSDEQCSCPWARAFEVIEALPFKEKALRAALRARDVGTLTIKKRGVSLTPEALRKRLRLNGRTTATIIVTRTPKAAVALLVRRCPPDGSSAPSAPRRSEP